MAKVARRLGYQDGFALKVALHAFFPHAVHDGRYSVSFDFSLLGEAPATSPDG
jgi:hypothetical protein